MEKATAGKPPARRWRVNRGPGSEDPVTAARGARNQETCDTSLDVNWRNARDRDVSSLE